MPADRKIQDAVRVLPVGAAQHWERSLVHNRTRAAEVVIRSWEESAITAADYCRQAIEIANSPEENNRRLLAHRRRMILYDAWKGLLVADIKNRLTSEELWQAVMGKSGEFADITRNSAKMIWEESSQLYKSPAARSTPASETDAERYKEILKGSLFHLFWQSVELHLMAFNDLILWPDVEERRGRRTIKHNMAAGDQVTVIKDAQLGGSDPLVLVFFDSAMVGDKLQTVYTVHTPWFKQLFTAGTGAEISANMMRIDEETLTPIDDEDDQGFGPGLHFVHLHADPMHPWYWDQTGGEDLVELTLKMGRRQTDDDYLWTRSSHKQLLIVGNLQQGSNKSLLDVSSVLNFIGDNLTSQLLDWSVDFKARQDVANGEEIRAAASRGINPERMRRSSYQDVGAAKFAERGLNERREHFEPIFARAEDEYYWQVAQLASDEGFTDPPNPDTELETKHAPIEYPGDPAAQIAVDEALERRGVQSIVDTVLRDHPSWDRAKAIEFIESNVKEMSKISKMKQEASVPENDLANRSAEDERNGAMGPEARDKPASTPPGIADPKPPASGE